MSRVLLGDGHGHFSPGPDLPSGATKTYSASLADMSKSGHLDIVLSNDEPEPRLVLLTTVMASFTLPRPTAILTRNEKSILLPIHSLDSFTICIGTGPKPMADHGGVARRPHSHEATAMPQS